MILQELSKAINLSLFNQKTGQDDVYKFTPNDMNFFKQQIGYFDKPCDRMATKLDQIEKSVMDVQMALLQPEYSLSEISEVLPGEPELSICIQNKKKPKKRQKKAKGRRSRKSRSVQ